MAKQKPAPDPQDWIVTLNGEETTPHTVNASTADEAIDKVIADTESKRDRRNYVAVPKSRAAEIENGPRPPIKANRPGG